MAHEGSVQGSVLLKNVAHTLPLGDAPGSVVAVIGPNANLSQAMAGYYGPAKVCGGKFPAMIDAVAAALPKARVTYMKGVPDVLSDNLTQVATHGFERALRRLFQ